MKFAYEDLSDDQFEVLIVLLCQRLLGIAGVSEFLCKRVGLQLTEMRSPN